LTSPEFYVTGDRIADAVRRAAARSSADRAWVLGIDGVPRRPAPDPLATAESEFEGYTMAENEPLP
jgi:hypothetical protein